METYGLYYPIEFAIPADSDYQIIDAAGAVVYSGRVAKMPGDTATPKVDIAPIMRQLVPVPDYGLVLQGVSDGDYGYNEQPQAMQFRIRTKTATTSFGVLWNYDKGDAYNGEKIIGGGIQDYVYRDQMFVVSARGLSGRIGDGSSGGFSFDPGTSGRWVADAVSEQSKTINIYTDRNGDDPVETYAIRDCPPDNAMILFYVDMRGGMSWVICDGKNTVRQNLARDQITHETYHDYYNLMLHGIENYRVASYESYNLNTGYLTDRQSERLQELFRSPRVWICGIHLPLLTPVVITDMAQDIKLQANSGRLFNYTIKCRESQTFEIYG